MRRPLAALVTLTQLHPLIAVALCLGLGVGPSERDRDCSQEAAHAPGQHAVAAPALAPVQGMTAGPRSEGTTSEGCPVAASCAPAPVAPSPLTPHAAGITPDGIRIGLPVDRIASLSQFPPPTPPPNS